ncbi:DUF4129 domain-containing protein [Flexivirga lutea]
MPGDGSSPLSPDGGTARGWLQRELAKPAYADQRSWVQRLWDWAMDRLHDLLNGLGSALPLYVLIPLLLVLVAIVVFGMSRLGRRSHVPAPGADGGVLTGVDLSAAELRDRARRSAADGAHAAAFVDYFRALTRRGEERALLLAQPGRTAHEVGAELTPYFPARSDGIRAAAAFFDRVRYGGAGATADDVERIRTLDRELDQTRPQHAAVQQVAR